MSTVLVTRFVKKYLLETWLSLSLSFSRIRDNELMRRADDLSRRYFAYFEGLFAYNLASVQIIMLIVLYAVSNDIANWTKIIFRI